MSNTADTNNKSTIYSILGEGTYGLVVAPALNNRGIKYRENVTKIFTSKYSYLEALQQAKNAMKIGPLAIKAEPYTNKYTVASLPNSIKNHVRERAKKSFLEENPIPYSVESKILRNAKASFEDQINTLTQKLINENGLNRIEAKKRATEELQDDIDELTNKLIADEQKKKLPVNNTGYPIYPLRLDNLGTDFSNILYKIKDNKIVINDENITTLRSIDYKVLLGQILHAFKVVKAIRDAGYIHGDIRETNVLCKIENGTSQIPLGTITIVDFDFLYQFDDFFTVFNTFFYSHPPEALLVWQRDKSLPKLLDPTFDNKPDDELKALIKSQLTKIRNEIDIYDTDIATESLFYIIKQIPKEFDLRQRRKAVYSLLKGLIDSYGIGIAFYKVFKEAWKYDEKNPMSPYYDDLSKLIDFDSKRDYDNFIAVRNDLIKILEGMIYSDARKLKGRINIDGAIEMLEESLRKHGMREVDVTDLNVAKELERMAFIANTYRNAHVYSKGLRMKKGGTRRVKKISRRKTRNHSNKIYI